MIYFNHLAISGEFPTLFTRMQSIVFDRALDPPWLVSLPPIPLHNRPLPAPKPYDEVGSAFEGRFKSPFEVFVYSFLSRHATRVPPQSNLLFVFFSCVEASDVLVARNPFY